MSFFDSISNLFSTTTAATPAPEAPMSPITAPEPVAMPASVCASSPSSAIANLEAALRAVAPHADPAVWVSALTPAFQRFLMADRPLRMAAALGQFAVESGCFARLSENDNYTTAARLVAVFPSEFPTIASAAGYVGNPTKIADRCYANRLGNGNEASGEGSRYAGKGLIQLTGKTAFAKFGDFMKMDAPTTAAYCLTPAGGAMSACWFLYANGCLPLADVWSISSITRKVNGPAMLSNAERITASNAARKAFGV